MNIYLDCVPCFLRQALDSVRFVTDDSAVREQILRSTLRLVAELDLNQPPPVVGQAIHRRIRAATGVEDPYRAAKSHFNRLAMNLLPELSRAVGRAHSPLLAAARLAIAANMIDLGVAGGLTEAEVKSALGQALREPFVGDDSAFGQSVVRANRILYLADNAGEIAIDRLLIGQLGPARTTLAVRGSAVINDATLVDAAETRLHELVEVVDNGSDAPGTILDDCSEAFRQGFAQADLIIAKGQGNFETLSEVEGNIFFLFKVKCPVIAAHVGLPAGTHALLRSGVDVRRGVTPRGP